MRKEEGEEEEIVANGFDRCGTAGSGWTNSDVEGRRLKVIKSSPIKPEIIPSDEVAN
jgi:hypothetical protein